MTSLSKLFLSIATVLLAALLPSIALASTLSPPGATDWDMYVYGNGRVIFDVLMGVKMLMIPDGGNSGFTYLLLLLASVGFLSLAIAAGFDPGKNLLKMFTFVLVVWLVTFSSTKLEANLVINDIAQNNANTGTVDYRIEGAPAIVVLPAALTSEVGHYFTRAIETYMNLPGEFKLAGQAVGQFNLFGRMMDEANQYVLTSPELKRSLSAYTADCVVTAMALGKLNGPVKSADGTFVTEYGTNALLRTSDMWATLSTAANPATMTTYFPMNAQNTDWQTRVSSALGPLASDAASLAQYGSSGVVVDCATAQSLLNDDLTQNAALLVEAGNEAWAKAGVMVPYETAMTTMLAQSAAPGSAAAGFSRPSGFIMQTALINSSTGAFRQAALQTGNSELMQAAALSQAEAQQKSAWASGFAMFNNMTGYVFTVLQAFIFALTPMIVVALMIPGMGKSIFVNYAQILVWLTLWQPTLAIVNFIIVLFGAESVSSTLYQDGGLSLANKALLSEKTNDLVIAAQFLGTMTPLISWGIVKGAMAFTEFISAGIGSAFAAQAGAAAATGNMSMNNLSMDNASMGQYNTMMSSKVGNQAVAGGVNAGALSGMHEAGGNSASANGGNVSESSQMSRQLSEKLSHQKSVSDAISFMQNKGYSESQLQSVAADSSASRAMRDAASNVLSKMHTAGESSSLSNGSSMGTSGTSTDSSTGGLSKSNGWRADASASLGIGGKAGLPGAGVSGGYDMGQQQTASASQSETEARSADNKMSASHGSSTGTALSAGDSFSHSQEGSRGNSLTERAASDKSSSLSTAYSQALSESNAVVSALESSMTVSDTTSFSRGTSMNSYGNAIGDVAAHEARMGAGLAAQTAGATGVSSGIEAGRQSLQSNAAAVTAGADADIQAFGKKARSGVGPGAAGGVAAEMASRGEALQTGMRETTQLANKHIQKAGTTRVDSLETGKSRAGKTSVNRGLDKASSTLQNLLPG